MIDLHYWPTPNGWKISIMLEECGLPYRMIPVNIGKGEQFTAEFLAISPNNRMPAIMDHAPAAGDAPLAMFESGAILIYLAEKTGFFLPTSGQARSQTLQWLMWQMGGLGPMAGQNGHFLLYAPEQVPYAIDRYAKEVDRLYGVLDGQLAHTGAFVAGEDYSIADMAIFPWIRTHKAQHIDLSQFPHIERWYHAMFERPAVKRGLDLGKALRTEGLTDDARKALFGQTASSVRGAVMSRPEPVIEFFFDCSSPWTYLAFRNLLPLAARLKVAIAWRPVLVGGIFNAVNPGVYAAREDWNSAKNRHVLKDVQDCARNSGVVMHFPPKIFPVNSVKAMRCCLWIAQDPAAQPKLLAFIEAVFAAYFTGQEDISSDEVLARLCSSVGVDPQACGAGMTWPSIKDQLKANTDEAMRRGAFGSPTFFIGDDMYFGNDRLPLVEAAVRQAACA